MCYYIATQSQTEIFYVFKLNEFYVRFLCTKPFRIKSTIITEFAIKG